MPNKFWRKHNYKLKLKQLKKSELSNVLNKNKQFKEIHQGKRCFILGNGPSLFDIDLSLLKNEITFTVNDLYYKDDFSKINTNYHVFSDPYYYKNLEEVVKRLMEKSKPSGIFFEGSKRKDMTNTNIEKEYPLFYFYNGIEIEDLQFVTPDLCKLLPYYCTVVQSALSIAIYMGFQEIYLLGCDCTGILNYIDRVKKGEIKNYAYQLPESEKVKQQSISISSEHMFFEWYHIFKSYRLLNVFMKKNDIKLINLTESGILDSIEKGNIKDVIQSK